jgi:Tfp pilus assembly protein PilF
LISALAVILVAGATPVFFGRPSASRRAYFELEVARKHLAHGQDEIALRHLAKAIEIKPDYARAHWLRADILVRQGKRELGEASLRRAVEVAPDRSDIRCSLAAFLSKRGRTAEAIEQYRKALEREPESAPLHNNLGVELAKAEQTTEAIRQLEWAISLDPRCVNAHRNLGQLLLDEGRPREALDHLEQAIELNPKDVGAVNSLAWLLSTCPMEGIRDGAKAVELAEQLCSTTGRKVGPFMDTLGAAYAEAGRFAEAVDAATAALDLAEQGPTAQEIQRRLELYQAGKPFRVDGS